MTLFTDNPIGADNDEESASHQVDVTHEPSDALRILLQSSVWKDVAGFMLEKRGVNLQEHLRMAIEATQLLAQSAHLDPVERQLAIELAAYHDIGKPKVERNDNELIPPGAQRHHDHSAEIARELGIKDERLIALILLHEKPWEFYRSYDGQSQFNSQKARRRLDQRLIDAGLEVEAGHRILALFAYSDRVADRRRHDVDFLTHEFRSPQYFETVIQPQYPGGVITLNQIALELFIAPTSDVEKVA